MSQVSIIDIEGSHPQIPTRFDANVGFAVPIANVLEIFGDTVPAGSIPVQTVGSGNNITTQVQISQAIASTDATKIGLAAFDSNSFTVDANGFVALIGGGVAIDSIGTQTGTNPIVPTAAGLVTINGAVVPAGTNPVRSDGTGPNTMALEVQISQAIPAADVNKIGLSNFDSASFSVSTTGYVTMAGGGGFTWSDISGSFSAAKNNGYFITGTATANLPALPSQGDTIKFFVDHASQVLTIDAPGTQIIRFGSLVSSAGGTFVSTLQGDSVELTYRASDTCWCAIAGFTGTWILT